MSEVEALLTQTEYIASRQRVFPSEQTLLWYIKKHRAALIEAGAILKVLRSWHVQPDKFDAFILAEAQRPSRGS